MQNNNYQQNSPYMYQQPPKKRRGCGTIFLIVFVAFVTGVIIRVTLYNFFISTLTHNIPTEHENITNVTTTERSSPIEIKEGKELIKNGYFEYKGLKFTHLGNYKFLIENNTDSDYIIVAGIYGKKKDGTYKWLETPSLSGPDEYKYQKDLKENGWATYENTNRVRSGKSQIMEMYPFEFDNEPLDVDNDGMYDISFTIHKQKDEDHVHVSSDAPQTPYYKIAAK